ncbi:MAG: type II toxin-antitoxin system mRNA interferase toxin, RelE/StbE family [Candidatus Aenigmarchaeota archaeon]|nr:type II toxin-antitoxin system mRNA interferase toxin, RelE/StbE family [Candidatus Aenigmarchaeota archaeon]
MYLVSRRPKLDQIFKKLAKKNPTQLEMISNKLEEILEDPYRFKPLSNIMKGLRRVHIDRNFVLVYSIDEQNKTVVLEDFDHHDNVYRR